jgi:lipid II:glycine glycyltransferase (peptidoglycan interpeptide bridge formation enzyme)
VNLVRSFEAAERSLTVARHCPVLDLDRPLEVIAAGYDPAVRRAIRRSAKEGVEVSATSDLALVKEAYPIYHATMERIGGTTKPWHFLEKLLRDGLAVPFMALRGGRPIGLVILLISGGMAIYWISAADISESTARPTNALVDAAIRWCHGRGIKRFSFGESPGERATLEKFKMGWGPDILNTVTWVRVYRPLVQKSWQALEPAARQAYALWDRLKRTDRRASANP